MGKIGQCKKCLKWHILLILTDFLYRKQWVSYETSQHYYVPIVPCWNFQWESQELRERKEEAGVLGLLLTTSGKSESFSSAVNVRIHMSMTKGFL